jgi:hypothetical protein
VLVVDYAETAMAWGRCWGCGGLDGPDTRVVLLAHGSAEWWQRLATGTDDHVTRLPGAPPARSGHSRPRGPAELFSEALTAFVGDSASPDGVMR